MIIGGLIKTSLVDYPGKISAIIFTKGCSFACHFCYNPLLVQPDKTALETSPNTEGHLRKLGQELAPNLISVDDLFLFLEKRAKQLDAVVITGGEPTIHHDLPDTIRRIKQLGYSIKLDTNGTNPAMLKKLLAEGLIDYLAMDLKGSKEKYSRVAGVPVDFKKIKESVKIIMTSGLPYEFRTTIVPGYLEPKDIASMGKIIKGADKWYLQKFKSDIALVDEALEGRKPYTDKEMVAMVKEGKKYVKLCEGR
jgi:pyruvate formate lyase activating enzyme